MTRWGGRDLREFAEGVKRIRPDLVVIVLGDQPRDLARYAEIEKRGAVDQVFMWHGDAKILLAIL